MRVGSLQVWAYYDEISIHPTLHVRHINMHGSKLNHGVGSWKPQHQAKSGSAAINVGSGASRKFIPRGNNPAGWSYGSFSHFYLIAGSVLNAIQRHKRSWCNLTLHSSILICQIFTPLQPPPPQRGTGGVKINWLLRNCGIESTVFIMWKYWQYGSPLIPVNCAQGSLSYLPGVPRTVTQVGARIINFPSSLLICPKKSPSWAVSTFPQLFAFYFRFSVLRKWMLGLGQRERLIRESTST
jgi:hypothetical protein